MTERSAREQSEEQVVSKALKRRGILAAAGAVVAGIVAKRAAAPVAATSGTGPDGNLVLGSNDINNTTNYANLRTQIVSGLGNPTGTGFHGAVLFDCSASPFQGSGDANAIGISGTSRGTAAGVYGTDDVGSKPSGYPAGMNAGIYGYTSAQGHSGVRGDGGANGIGVSGVSTNSNAILGTTLSSVFNQHAAVFGLGYGIGVEGDVPAGSTIASTVAVKGVNASTGAGGVGVQGEIASGSVAANAIAVYGVNYSYGGNTTGVYGAAAVGNGVVGVTYGTGVLAGVMGSTTAAGYSGLTAITGTPGVAALAATSTVNTAYAAYFQGSTVVQGDFAVVGGNKSAAVKDASGQHRLVYCMESPEAWFEDFGEGKVVGGKGDVKLDPLFAQIVHTDAYHVFLTPRGDCKGLYVANQSSAGFTVQELQGGASSLGFSYRVVAKRADSKGERLAKFEIPKIRVPDESKLPKAAPPKAAPSPLPSPKP